MKTIRVSEETHSKLLAVAAYLTLDLQKHSPGEKASLEDAIKHLLEQKQKETT